MGTSVKTVEEYVNRQYRYVVIAEREGGYFIKYPDLPGCVSQVDTEDEVGQAAVEIKRLWIESAFDDGIEIPDPSFPEEASGKFNLRLPKSLHRRLVEVAEEEGVSLNQMVVSLLSERLAASEANTKLDEITVALRRIEQNLAQSIRRHDSEPVQSSGWRTDFVVLESVAVSRNNATFTSGTISDESSVEAPELETAVAA